jgi:hypothetical protein
MWVCGAETSVCTPDRALLRVPTHYYLDYLGHCPDAVFSHGLAALQLQMRSFPELTVSGVVKPQCRAFCAWLRQLLMGC